MPVYAFSGIRHCGDSRPKPGSAKPRNPLIVRGARTHNLKNIDVTLPAGKLIIITGVSGSGKSSLAFDTIYAEGQRRYVESLSAYARQFLERMEKPDVDRIEGICPAIAIRQKNSVRNPRSTVGTTTEIHDYMRLLFARVGRTFCRQCGQEVIRETAEVVRERLGELPDGHAPADRLRDSGRLDCGERLRPRSDGENGDEGELRRRWNRPAKAVQTAIARNARRAAAPRLRPAADRRPAVAFEEIDPAALRHAHDARGRRRSRADRRRSAQPADRLDRDVLSRRRRRASRVRRDRDQGSGTRNPARTRSPSRGSSSPSASNAAPAASPTRRRSRGSSRSTTRSAPARRATASATSSSSTWSWSCPTPSKSINQGAIEPWSKPHYRAQLAELKRAARKAGIRLDVPWTDLTDDERRFVVEGDGDYEGIRGFFRWLERKKYKVHVRVFLSRYRGYLACPDCGGARLRREARDVRVGGRTIDDVSALTVHAAQQFFAELQLTEKETAVADKVLREIRRRLSFLSDVGLDYLTLDRLSSTLSGGESQRINLATSLGSALVGTLYVLDEPSIGLHSRDNQRLIDILRQLRDQGNTVLVVEHDEDMIRVADHIVDIGLGAGEQGGRVVYSGDLPGLLQEPRSLTAKYLRQRAGDSGAVAAAQRASARRSGCGRERAQPEGRRRRRSR